MLSGRLASTLRSTTPNADIHGESSGTAEQLAKFILAERPRPTKLLYLTGDKIRDTLPSILGGAGVSLCSLKVNETQGNSTFLQYLKKIVPENRLGHGGLCSLHRQLLNLFYYT